MDRAARSRFRHARWNPTARLALAVIASLSIATTPAHADPPYGYGTWATPAFMGVSVSPNGEVTTIGLQGTIPNRQSVMRVFSPSGALLRSAIGAIEGVCGTQWLSGRFAVAPDGSLFIASDCARMYHVSASGVTLSWFDFPLPGGGGNYMNVSVDPAGNVWVSTSPPLLREVRKFSPTGVLLTTLDLGSPPGNPDVYGVHADGAGYVWVGQGQSLWKYRLDGSFVATYPIVGPALPIDIQHDAAGRIYVVGPASVAVIDSSGVQIDSWSSWTDGIPGSLLYPLDLAISPFGDIYVAEADQITHLGYAMPPAPQATLDGVTNTAVGGASLQNVGAGLIKLTNIGSSGNDGVTFPPETPDMGRGIEFSGGLPLDPDVDAGGGLEAHMSATVAGQAASYGRVRVDVVADGLDITPDFTDVGAADVDVVALVDSQEVFSCRVPNGTILHRDTPGSLARSGPRSALAAGDGIQGVEVGLKKKPGGSCGHLTLAFTSTRTVTLNGTPVAANRLVLSAPAPRQPISATSASLTVRTPSATLQRARAARGLPPSNLNTVAIAGEPSLEDTDGHALGGIRAEAVGGASVNASSSSSDVLLTNIGSSGQDGVDLDLTSSSGAVHAFGDRMGFNTATDVGAELVHQVRGKVGCVPDSVVAVATETVYADSIALKADFANLGATGLAITILDADSVVHQGTYGTGQSVQLVELVNAPGFAPQAASINTSRSNLKEKASLASSGASVSIKYKRPGPSSGPGLRSQAMGFDLMVDGVRYQGDEVQFTAVGATPVAEITGAALRQRNPGVARLDSLRITRPGLAVGSTGVANVSKGEAALLAFNGSLVVHNIGSSGQDGVAVTPPKPVSQISVRESGLGPANTWPAASAMSFTSRGSRNGGPVLPVLAVGADKVGGSLRMGPRALPPSPLRGGPVSASASSYRLQLLLNGVVIATRDAATPQVDFDRMPDVSSSTAAGPTYEGRWDAPLTLSVVGGPSLVGNGVRIRPLGEPDDVSSISAMDVAAAGIPTFTLGNWQAPVAGVEPTVGTGARLTLARNPIRREGGLALATETPSPAWIELEVLDAQGRRTATVFRGMQTAGTVNRVWAPPAAMSSGLYFVRLTSGGRRLAEKFTYIR